MKGSCLPALGLRPDVIARAVQMFAAPKIAIEAPMPADWSKPGEMTARDIRDYAILASKMTPGKSRFGDSWHDQDLQKVYKRAYFRDRARARRTSQ